MIHLKRILLSASLFLIFSISNFAQKKSVAEIESMAGGFLRIQHLNSGESIFVHTDKWFYLAGETIWFKAYCINSLSHKVDRKSKTLFLDLVDNNDKVIRQVLLNNLRLLTAGNIILPENLEEGDYWLRAYTMDMLQQDSSQIFVKHVYVFNGGKAGPIHTNGDDHPKQLTFFPEGGSLIEGTDQTIAIRTSDEYGKPISVPGYITNDEDSVKAKFITTAKGLAKFNLFLSPNERFTAHIKNTDGSELLFQLPEPDARTAAMSVSKETDTSLLLTVALGDSLLKYDAETTVLGFNRDRLCFAATGHGMYELPISKRSFPGGVNNLILFNKQQLVLSERSFYQNKRNLVVNIKPDRMVYGDREKVNVDISLSDASKFPVTALLSVTVTDDNVVTQPPEKDEAASLPSDDVAEKENYTLEERELMLLTEKKRFTGWEYEKLRSTNGTDAMGSKDFAGISGRVVNKAKVAQKNLVVTMFSNQDRDGVVYGMDTTDENGRFSFPIPSFKDSTGFQLDVANLRGLQQDVVLEMDSMSMPTFKTPAFLKVRFFGAAPNALQYFKTYSLDSVLYGRGKQWLKPVTVGARRKKPFDYVESKRASQFSKIITHDNFSPGVHGVTNALLMAPGVHYFNGLVNIGGTAGFDLDQGNEPMLVIDGVPVYSKGIMNDYDPSVNKTSPLLSYLDQFDPSTIDFIEILSGPEAALYGAHGGKGVILVYTMNRQRLEKNQSGPGLKTFYTKGYANAADFTGPDYSKENEMKNPGSDQRPTIYWNGNVLSDDNGRASLSFFTSDNPTTYTLTIQGITLNGDIIYKRAVIQRK